MYKYQFNYNFCRPKTRGMHNNNSNNMELAQSILELTSYPLMVSSLQSLHNQSEAKHRDVIEQLKTLLILQPEQIYINYSNLTIDRIKLIRDIFRIENNLDAKYFQTTSGYILIAVAQGFLLQNLTPQKMNKLKQIFARKLQRSTHLWGFGQLQNLQAYLIDKSTGYFPTSSPIHHDLQIERFSYFLQFYGSYQSIFPQLTDILSIFFKIMLCLREERQKDRQLMAKIKQKYLESRYHYQTTTKNMKFVLQFFKHSYSEKDCLYYPQKSLQSILSSYSSEQIQHLLHVTSVGVLWQQYQVYQYFLNCIKLGFSEISRKMMISMIKFCEKSGKFNELLYSYENNIKRIFIFMKFPKFFNPCIEILKYCILSPPSTISLYQKFLSEAVVFMGKVDDNQHKYAFLNLLQIVSFAYNDSAPMEELKKIITENIENEVNKLTQEEIKKILQEYSWKEKLNNKNNSLNVIAENKSKSNYKGLINIGNSCYMNSFLQSLFMNRQFLKHIIRSSTLQIRVDKLKDKKYEGKPKQYIQKDIQQSVKPFAELQKTFALLLKSIRNEVSPSNIRLVAPQMFRNSSQHDTIEFGRCFLELIFRNIPAMFQGEVTTQIFCKECSQVRQRKQAFLDYHVSTQSGELQELIQNSFKQEIVEGLTCDHCQKKGKESIKHHFISKFPNYLIISINRFQYDVIEKRNKKNKSKIIVNPFLKIAEIQYEIYSIIIHTGPSPNAGHYFTFSKTKYEPNCKWICHNDSQVSQFQDFGQVNSFLENSEEDTPYILFYEKREHIAKMKEELSQSIVLRQPQQKFVKKQNETYLTSQKKVKFQLQPINYNFFMKNDDEDEDNRGNGGGGGFYNSYIA